MKSKILLLLVLCIATRSECTRDKNLEILRKAARHCTTCGYKDVAKEIWKKILSNSLATLEDLKRSVVSFYKLKDYDQAFSLMKEVIEQGDRINEENRMQYMLIFRDVSLIRPLTRQEISYAAGVAQYISNTNARNIAFRHIMEASSAVSNNNNNQ